MNSKQVAKLIQNSLIEKGFTIHRYNAYSTNSIYLKVDGGLCKSIRISDHTGKKHLRYSYNLLSTLSEGYSEVDREVTRYYYPYDEWEIVVNLIVDYRDSLISKYGSRWYYKELKLKCQQGGKGFWSGAYLVNKKA